MKHPETTEKSPDALVINLRGTGRAVRRIVFELTGAITARVTPTIVSRSKESPQEKQLREAIRRVSECGSILSFDPDACAVDTLFQEAVNKEFEPAIRQIAGHGSKQEITTLEASFDGIMRRLSRQLPYLRQLEPDHPDLAKWRWCLEYQYDAVVNQILNPLPQKK